MREPQPEPRARTTVIIVTAGCRDTKRRVGPTAWAVLEDVALDALPMDGRWEAKTSVRLVAGNLGLTPGTVARALVRLCSEGLVHRIDRRDHRTGRFDESVYVLGGDAVLLPCVDLPQTAECDTVASSSPHLPGTSCRTNKTRNPEISTPETIHRDPATHQPNYQSDYSTEHPKPITQRATNTCQPSGQASPRRA